MKNEFMQFKQLSADETELYIYGEIRKVGMFEKAISKEYEVDIDAVSALTFKEALESVETKNLTVRINSNGGSVSEALAIYSQLNDFKGNITTKVDGIAASAASVIFMVGKDRVVPSSALLMIHNAWSFAMGNASELRKMADDLDKITQPSIDIYSEKTGQNVEVIKNLLDNETWITSKEALDLGFATKSIADETEMSYQQNALLSLVKENKKLRQKNQKAEIDYEKLAEAISQKNKVKKSRSHSKWDGFFSAKSTEGE